MRFLFFFLVCFQLSAQIPEPLKIAIEQQNDSVYLGSEPDGLVRLGEKKAFPTAIGHAYDVTGNQTGQVYKVSNPNPSGPGSLAAAKNIGDNWTIQFNISGIIDMDDVDMTFRGNNLTFAFETAPSPGITLKGGAILIRGSNVVIRHGRFREGYSANTSIRSPFKAGPDATSGNISGLILDHCVLGWSTDQNYSVGGAVNSFTKLTLQNSLVHEGILPNSYATIIGNNTKEVSMIKNLFHSNKARIPESPNGQFEPSWEFLNNLVYNYERASTASFGSTADVVNNVYHSIGTNPPRGNLSYQGEFWDGTGTDTRLAIGAGRVHDSGNIQLGTNTFGMYDQQWDEEHQPTRGVPSSYEPIPAGEVVSYVLNDTGATAFPDPVRDRLITEYTNLQGDRSISNESEVGGFPTIAENFYEDYWASGDRVSQEFKDTYAFSDDMSKPVTFTINGMVFDNRTYDGGTYVNGDGETQNEYIGGTWTGGYNYTWWDFFRFWKAKDFEPEKWP